MHVWKVQGIDPFPDSRNIHDYKRRHGDLPAQQEGDAVDYRPLLHRDGSVISYVPLDALKARENLYVDLGTKLVVGMPFKDIATSDSIFMKEIPDSTDTEGRRTLKRLQEVGVHVIAPANVLAANPLPHAVALMNLKVRAILDGVELLWVVGELAIYNVGWLAMFSRMLHQQ